MEVAGASTAPPSSTSSSVWAAPATTRRERFTMDEEYQKAVAKVFVALYEKGDIYRDVYLVNWCVRCGSAISDLEVEHEDRAGQALLRELSHRRLERVPDGGHHAPGDHPGRHRGGREPQGPPLRSLRGPLCAGASGGARGAHHRRRARGRRLRHRRPEDHPRARPGRLGDRAAPRSAQRVRDRTGRPHERRGRGVRGHDRARRPRSGRRAPAGARPLRQGRGPRPCGRHLLPLRHHHRAASLSAVVHGHEAPCPAGHRRGGGRPGAFRARALG